MGAALGADDGTAVGLALEGFAELGLGLGTRVEGTDVGADVLGKALGLELGTFVVGRRVVGNDVGDGTGRDVGLPGSTVGFGGRTGAAVGVGVEHPQAPSQLSWARELSSPTTAQRFSDAAATHAQCFDGVPFLCQDVLSTHAVGAETGRAVGFPGATAGAGVGRGTGARDGSNAATVGGVEHPQAPSQLSWASESSSPTTAQRFSGAAATHAQCFDGVPFLCQDVLSTHAVAGIKRLAVGTAVVDSLPTATEGGRVVWNATVWTSIASWLASSATAHPSKASSSSTASLMGEVPSVVVVAVVSSSAKSLARLSTTALASKSTSK